MAGIILTTDQPSSSTSMQPCCYLPVSQYGAWTVAVSNQPPFLFDGNGNLLIAGTVVTSVSIGTVAVTQDTIPWVVSVSNTPSVTLSGASTVSVSNFPATIAVTQSTSPWIDSVTGTVTIANPVSTVSVSNFPTSYPVTGTVSVSNEIATVTVGNTVSVTVTNPVSTVSVNNFPAQLATIAVTQSTSPWIDSVTGTVSVSNTVAISGTVNATIPAAIAVTQSTSPWVTSGTVSLTNPSTVVISGTVTTSPQGTIAVTQSTSPWITSGTVSVSNTPAVTIASGTSNVLDTFNAGTAVTWTSANAANSTIAINTTGYANVSVALSGTASSGVISFEVSNDSGSTWHGIDMCQISGYGVNQTYGLGGGANAWQMFTGGFNDFRIRLATAISGGGGTAILSITPSVIANEPAVAVGGIVSIGGGTISLANPSTVIATLSGTANTVSVVGGTINNTILPAASGGLTIASGSTGSTVQVIKASAGQIYGWYFYNSNTVVTYCQIFNAASASVTLGSTAPTMALGIPAQSGANVLNSMGISFSTAITMAFTTTRTGSTAPANTIDWNILYD
jgi:hypothetical protein